MPSTPAPPLTEPAFARTYNHQAYADPWNAVQDYRRVQDYKEDHPDYGGWAIHADLEDILVNPTTVDGWLDEHTPDVVRGLEIAHDRRWFPGTFEAERFRLLNVLVAHVFAAGSINTNYSPYLLEAPASWPDRLRSRIGIDWRENSRSQNRTDEYTPKEDGSVLGRILAVLGAPVGTKNRQAPITVPDYLAHAPHEIRRDWVRAYVDCRATEHEGKATLQLQEQRPDGYTTQLAQLIRQVTGEDASGGSRNVTVSADAARTINEWPEPLNISSGDEMKEWL